MSSAFDQWLDEMKKPKIFDIETVSGREAIEFPIPLIATKICVTTQYSRFQPCSTFVYRRIPRPPTRRALKLRRKLRCRRRRMNS